MRSPRNVISVAKYPQMTDLGVSLARIVVKQGNRMERSICVIGEGVYDLPSTLSSAKYDGAFCRERSLQVAFAVEPPSASRPRSEDKCECPRGQCRPEWNVFAQEEEAGQDQHTASDGDGK